MSSLVSPTLDTVYLCEHIKYFWIPEEASPRQTQQEVRSFILNSC